MPTGPQLRAEVSLILRVVAYCFKRKETSSMKRVAIVLTVGLIAGLLAGHQKAFAQGGQVEISSAGAPSSDLPMADLQAFEEDPGNFIPPSRGMGAAHHRHHKAAKESAAKAGGEGGAAAAAPSSPAGAPAAEGGGAPEAAGSPAGAEGGGAASSAATPAASGSTGGH